MIFHSSSVISSSARRCSISWTISANFSWSAGGQSNTRSRNLFHLISGHVGSIAHSPLNAWAANQSHRAFTFSSAHVRFAEARQRLSDFATWPKSLNMLAGAGGFEPPNGGIKIRCLTTWLRPNAPSDCRRPQRAGRRTIASATAADQCWRRSRGYQRRRAPCNPIIYNNSLPAPSSAGGAAGISRRAGNHDRPQSS